jgi:hypothetical protein
MAGRPKAVSCFLGYSNVVSDKEAVAAVLQAGPDAGQYLVDGGFISKGNIMNKVTYQTTSPVQYSTWSVRRWH